MTSLAYDPWELFLPLVVKPEHCQKGNLVRTKSQDSSSVRKTHLSLKLSRSQ